MEKVTQQQVKPRRFLWGTILILIILFSYYTWFIEPNNIMLKKEKIKIGLSEPVKIVFISDIHIETISDGYLEKAVVFINSQQPDYVLIGGDFSEGDNSALSRLKPLDNLNPLNATYAVYGNHDYPFNESTCRTNTNNSLVRKTEFLESIGIKVVRNQIVNSENFYLVGIDELWACKNNYSEAMKVINESKPSIILVHNSDALDQEQLEENNLILSGHTHCGQWRLPYIGSPLKHLGLISQYDMGLHKIDGDSYIYTTCGLGGGSRFLAPPEITVIEVE